MNRKSTNEKIINALHDLEPIHEETDEEKEERLKIEKEVLEKATAEPPLAFPRKVAGYICIAIWVFSVFALIFGMSEIGIILPFMLIALGAYFGLNIPVYVQKGKISDIIISILATAVCVILAIGILTVGGK